MLSLFLDRCTFWFIVASMLAAAAIHISCVKKNLALALCCFAVAWQIAIVDSAIWILDSFREMGNFVVPRGILIYEQLITSLFSLVSPLVALAAICVNDYPEQLVGRGPKLLFLSCCIGLVGLIFLLLTCSLMADVMCYPISN
jgi:hypothetical protein